MKDRSAWPAAAHAGWVELRRGLAALAGDIAEIDLSEDLGVELTCVGPRGNW